MEAATANLVENSEDLAVWMNPETRVRFYKETSKRSFVIAVEGVKFATYDEACEYAARQ